MYTALLKGLDKQYTGEQQGNAQYRCLCSTCSVSKPYHKYCTHQTDHDLHCFTSYQ